MRNFFAVAMAATSSGVLGQAGLTQSQRLEIREFDDVVARYGYFYEMYQVETEDDWTLTLFRIKGQNKAT